MSILLKLFLSRDFGFQRFESRIFHPGNFLIENWDFRDLEFFISEIRDFSDPGFLSRGKGILHRSGDF